MILDLGVAGGVIPLNCFVFQAKKIEIRIFFYVSGFVKEESSEPPGLTLSSGTSSRHKSQTNNENNEDLEL